MTFWDFINGLIANDQVRILVGLIIGNLVLGVAAAIANPSDHFDLTRVGDYARARVLPCLAVYSVGALVSWAAPLDPVLSHLRDLIFLTESAMLVGLLFSNLRDLGISVPSTLAGPPVPPASVAIDGHETGGKVEITGAKTGKAA